MDPKENTPPSEPDIYIVPTAGMTIPQWEKTKDDYLKNGFVYDPSIVVFSRIPKIEETNG